MRWTSLHECRTRPVSIAIASSTSEHLFQPLEAILGNLPQHFPVANLTIPSIHPDYVNWLAARLDAKSQLR